MCTRTAYLTAFGLLLAAGASACHDRGPRPPDGHAVAHGPARWGGEIELPGGADPLAFSVAFDGEGGATISIPMQGVEGMPLTKVVRDAHKLEFTLEVPGGAASVSATRTGDGAAEGIFAQRGALLPVRLRRLDEGEQIGPRRPQTPAPPWPYEVREATWPGGDDGVTLAGTLTVPNGPGPHPAVLLITGSGAQDRDETLFGHKPFLVIADHLTRRGVAVLRVDDRGIGGSTGDAAAVTLDSNARDALASVRWMRGQARVDPERVGVMGHSEGGILAAMAAARDPKIAFVVSLAGTGVRGAELLVAQLEAILRTDGASPGDVARQAKAQEALMQAILDDVDGDALAAAVRRLVEAETAASPEAAATVRQQGGVAAVVAAQVKAVGSPWFRAFVAHDPASDWRRVTCPVLALGGTLDVQVPAGDNLAAIAAAAAEGGHEDVETHALAGLNHLFQPAKTGSPKEYAAIETTFDEGALALLTRWIRGTVGRAGGGRR